MNQGSENKGYRQRRHVRSLSYRSVNIATQKEQRATGGLAALEDVHGERA